MLNDRQEEELINYIHHLCERCLPPTPKIVANIAQELCGRRLSKSSSSRFVARHKHRLDARYLNTIDLARHRADSRSNYEAYFAINGQKVEEHKISADNVYNMDEKGFLIGKLPEVVHKVVVPSTKVDSGWLVLPESLEGIFDLHGKLSFVFLNNEARSIASVSADIVDYAGDINKIRRRELSRTTKPKTVII
jgi:hypothetical protein